MDIKIVKSALSLHFCQGASCRSIAGNLRISRTTVSRLIAKAVDSHQPWEELSKLDDSKLMEALHLVDECSNFVEPNFDTFYQMLCRNKKLTIKAAYSIYYNTGNSKNEKKGARYYSLSRFGEKYAAWLKDHHNGIAVSKIPCGPGELLEIDYSGDKMEYTDRQGKKHKVEIFVAALRYSSFIFAMATEDQTITSWLNGIVGALNYIGGVPLSLSCDNAKALVTKPDKFVGTLSSGLEQCCNYYGMTGHSCRVRHPSEKSQAESCANWFQTHIQAPWIAQEQTIFADDLPSFNAKILKRVDEFNRKPFTQKGLGSRYSVLEQEESPVLRKLPVIPFEVGEWRVLTADSRYLVKFERHRYMVSWTNASKPVAVKISATHLRFFELGSGKAIGEHQRDYSLHGKDHVLDYCLSEADKSFRSGAFGYIEKYKEKNDGEILPFTEMHIIKIMEDENIPSMLKNRHLTGILSLCTKYGFNEVELALRIIKDTPILDKYRRTKMLVENNEEPELEELLTRVTPPEPEQKSEQSTANTQLTYLRGK